MRKNWNPNEIDYLKKSYGVNTDKCIAENLSRSISSVRSKAKKLGIKKKDNSELLTVTTFCEVTKIPRSTVTYWLEHCKFPTKKIGKYRKVIPTSFWRWASKNKGRINWSHLPKNCLSDEPKWVQELRDENFNQVNRRREWSTFEINKLKHLLKKEKYTYLEISKELNRSHSAIKRKIYDLNLLYTPIYKDKNNHYTEKEIIEAAELLSKGITLNAVASKLNRSEMGLRGKLEREGYIFKGKVLVK